MGKIFVSCIPLIRLQEDLPSLRHIPMLRYSIGYFFFFFFLLKERVPLEVIWQWWAESCGGFVCSVSSTNSRAYLLNFGDVKVLSSTRYFVSEELYKNVPELLSELILACFKFVTYPTIFCASPQVLVLLDVTPDQSMVDEGVAREVINRIQKLRKKVRKRWFGTRHFNLRSSNLWAICSRNWPL